MPISDNEAVWPLCMKYGEPLSGPIEAHMRKMRVPPDPGVVADVALDACINFLKLKPEARPKEPLNYLVGIARNLVNAKYLRSPLLSSPTRIGSGLVSIEETTEKDLNHLSEDPTEDLAKAIDLEDALETLKDAKPEEHHVLSELLNGKSIDELQQELNADRDRINYLRRRAVTRTRNHIDGVTGKENNS